MGFLGVYKALYDYEPRGEGELAITEGTLLYVLDKQGDDGWWKAKTKSTGDDEEEPEGLVPTTYVEEAEPTGHAKALYEYTRQTDEELSFPEEAELAIYDTSDPDWILAGYDGDFGFVPSNYIDMSVSTTTPRAGTATADAAATRQSEPEPEPYQTPPPALPSRQATFEEDDDVGPSLPPRNGAPGSPTGPSGAAAALANVLAGRSATAQRPSTPPPSLPARPRYMSDASEEGDLQSPPLPTRPRPQAHFDDDEPTPPLPQRTNSAAHGGDRGRDRYNDDAGGDGQPPTPGSFHLYNISEMVSVMGKRKKMPTTLGINLKTGKILIAPERAQDGPSQEWTADKMTHYSREGKHVFMELVRPSKSVDFHAGAKDTAEEIVSALGEMAGAVRAEGLREVIMAGTGQELKKAVVLYDFMAQGDDEVTVAVGDEVVILDDSRSEDWCQVRRVKNGKEGVVPSSYVEITGTITSDIPAPDISASGPSSLPSSPTTKTKPAISTAAAAAGAKTTVRHNRMDEERMTREAVRAAMKDERQTSEVGPGVHLPARRSSLAATTNGDNNNNEPQQRQRRKENGSSSRSQKSKPDMSKVRTWTDRTKTFSVEAQFVGLKDGKINLHKLNGVTIAVAVSKMSVEDLEYVESITGVSLDEDKPLSSVKRRSQMQRQQQNSDNGLSVGVSLEAPKKPEYDWFQFFLNCDVAVGLCERYTQAFIKDNMDESVLPDIDASVLRTLGLREGDIIKVMRFLDSKFGRSKKKTGGDDEGGEGGLFSGPGGTLRNNTRRGRPTPTTQASDVVDAKAFSQQSTGNATEAPTNGSSGVASAAAQAGAAKHSGGFDDDAWDVKPSRQQPSPAQPEPSAATSSAARPSEPAPAPQPAARQTAALTGSMQELSLLTQPLPVEKLNPTPPPPAVVLPPQPTGAQTQPQAAPPLPGASPAVFSGIAQQQTSLNGGLQAQPTAYGRARPLAPQQTQGQGGLLPPPPSRPLSAPQSAQASAFAPPPLYPQMTGITRGQVAPPGQSLNDLTQAQQQQRYFQQMQQAGMMPQPTGMMPQPTGMMPQPTGMMPMMTGMPMQQQQPQATGFGMPGQFPVNQMGQMGQMNQFGQQMQMQPTGFGGPFMPQATGAGLNAILPPALEPQRTSMPSMQQSMPPMQQPMQQQAPQPMQPQQTGSFTQGFGNHGMAPTPAVLQPQKTGPPPPVRFGVTEANKRLQPQPTGRKANLSAATADNPFGF